MLEQQKDRVVERQWELEPCLDAAMEAMLQQHKDTLAEFQKLKFQALLRELNVESDIDDATLPEVEKAAQRLIQWSANRGHDRVEENLRELQGLMLEYADWLHVEEDESACLLLAKFRYLLMLLEAKQMSPRDVSLFEVERKIQDIAVNASARYATRLNMIARDLEGWRALCNDATASSSGKPTFWSKLPHAPSQAPGKRIHAARCNSESSVQSDSASSIQAYEKLEQCSAAPHCPELDTKHKKKRKMTPERQEEYEYLYAGQAHCLQCLKYYRSLANFDLHCASSSKGVRQWAQTDEDGKVTRQIPSEIEDWLSSCNL